MESYQTLSEAINALQKQGYIVDFNLKQNCLQSLNGGHQILHDEFKIDKFFRFEGNTDLEDESILYAISSDKYHLKGTLVNAYGIYSDDIANEMIKKLKID